MSTPYTDMRIVNLSSGLPGAYCSKLFVDAGADVIVVEPPEGNPLRSWRVGGGPTNGDGALFRYLHHGQRSATGDVDAWVASADMVIVDLDGPDAGSLVAANPGLVVVAISPYGRKGPYADRPATEFTLQADSGVISGRGHPDGEPFQAGGRTGDWFGGVTAAVGAAAALRVARRTGQGELVDVSLAEATNACMSLFASLSAALMGPEALARPGRILETPSIEPTKDGYVGFNTNTAQMFSDFCVMIGRPDVNERFASFAARGEFWDEWNEIVRSWTSEQTTADAVEQATALRIPVAPVCNGKTVQHVDQFLERNVFVRDPKDEFTMPRRPWLIGDEAPPPFRPSPAIGDAGRPDSRARNVPSTTSEKRLPLDGITVLDATAWWAGPSSTSVLAALGAEVIHLESASRPDGMRGGGGAFIDLDSWWERSSGFLGANANKKGLTLDLSTEGGRGRELFLELVAKVDVVVENYTPRVFDQFGFSWDALKAKNPGVILMRMPAFGLDGPWRDRPGFAQTMEQVTGLAWVTGFEDDQPRLQRGPCDPNAGWHAAFALIAALEQREATGEGFLLETTMVEAALNIAAEFVIEQTAYGNLMERAGNAGPYAAPQGSYPCRETETRLAISCATDAQWQTLANEIGRADLAALTESERRARRDEIDGILAAWAKERADTEAADQLAAVGVPAAIVRDGRLAAEHPQFEARGYMEDLDHAVVGSLPTPSLPFRYASVDRWLHTAAPTLGQHNTEILGRLGLDAAARAKLTEERIIGDTVLFA